MKTDNADRSLPEIRHNESLGGLIKILQEFQQVHGDIHVLVV